MGEPCLGGTSTPHVDGVSGHLQHSMGKLHIPTRGTNKLRLLCYCTQIHASSAPLPRAFASHRPPSSSPLSGQSRGRPRANYAAVPFVLRSLSHPQTESNHEACDTASLRAYRNHTERASTRANACNVRHVRRPCNNPLIRLYLLRVGRVWHVIAPLTIGSIRIRRHVW